MAISNSTESLSFPVHNASSMAGVASTQHEKKSCSSPFLVGDFLDLLDATQLLSLRGFRIRVSFPCLHHDQSQAGYVDHQSMSIVEGSVVAVIVPLAGYVEHSGIIFLQDGVGHPYCLDRSWGLIGIL